MKRYIYLLCALALACMVLSYTAAHAQKKNDPGKKAGENDDKDGKGFIGSGTLSIGFKTYYIWWDPAEEWGGSSYKLKENYLHSFLYNPVFSVVFNEKWSMTGGVMIGRFYTEKVNSNIPISVYSKSSIEASKYDADLLFNAKVMPWMKVYFGLKYLGTVMKVKSRDIVFSGGSFIPLPGSASYPWHSIGFGVGNAYTIHVVENLYVLPNYACMFLGSVTTRATGSVKLTVGVMGSFSFAYYIEKARLTVEAGGRVQYLHNFFVGGTTSSVSGQKYDLFFGPYVGLVFAF